MYSIYHIEGVKIGVSKNVKRRVKVQGYDTYEILEEHTDIYEVSNREQQLQKEYGYKVDTKPYWQTIKMPTKEGCSKGGKIGGKIAGKMAYESGRLKKIASLGGKTGGKITGKINGKIAGKAAVESGQLAKIHLANRKPIIQYDNDGTFIKEWDSIKEAANQLNLNPPCICNVCKGINKKTGGYIFKYKEV